MKVLDKVLRRLGLVRLSAQPFRSVTIAHHHPKAYWPVTSSPQMTIDAVTRRGVRVTGELFVTEGLYRLPDVFKRVDPR